MAPKEARNANASATPPNWASTPLSEVVKRLATPPVLAVLTAYASNPPRTAPPSEVTAARTTDWRRPRTTEALVSASMLPIVGWLSPSTNAPTTTTTVGMSRKTVV